jgi:hypothetical protein
MQVSSGGSQSSKKKISYPKPKKGIVGVTTKKTPIKKSSSKSSSKKSSSSYKGGGNSGLMDRFFNAIKKDGKKVVNWAKQPGHLVPTKITHQPETGFSSKKKAPAKKPVAKKPVVHKPAPKPVAKPTIIRKAPVLPKAKAPVPSKASAYDKFKAIQKTAAHTVQKPTSIVKKGTIVQKPAPPKKSNALGQAGLDPAKYHAVAKKPTTSKPVVAPKAPVVAKPKTGTYTPPRPSSVTPTKAPVTPVTPTKPVTPVPGKPVAPTTAPTTAKPTTPTAPTTTPTAPTTPDSNPYTDQQNQLAKDRQAALNAQDVSLNQGLTAQDATNFQQFQTLQQQMSNRGMSDSGIAADAYMRSQMGANANYQKAYADAATNKSDIQSKYDTAISQSKIDDMQYADKMAIAQADSDAKFATAQTEQDKYLTSATGTVYVGGKQLIINGKPVQSMDWNKLDETQRHNMATEANTATANANTATNNANNFALGQDKNAIARETAANNLTIAISRNKLDEAKLDFNYKKLDADNADQQAKLQIAIANAQTSKDKTQLTALGKQTDTLAKQISAIQKKKTQTKADKAALKKLVSQYNKTNNAISAIVGGSSFKTSGGGGDYNNAPSGSPAAFGGFRRVNQAPSSFNGQMSQAISKGVPFAQSKLLTELIGRESGFRSSAKNPTSSAYGYGQFLTSTRNSYAKKYPNLNYNNPVDQIVLTYKYIQERYGTVQHALEMWEKRSPHWY